MINKEFTFGPHIEYPKSRSIKLLTFIIPSLQDFNSVYALKNVYCAVVRSVTEYACPIWSPHYKKWIDKIEKVQKKFLRHVGYRLRIPRDELLYSDILTFLEMSSLEKRRLYFDLCTLFRVVNGLIVSPALLQLINFKVSTRQTRQNMTFDVSSHVTNYGFYSPISRICREANRLPPTVDFFNSSFNKFKIDVKKYISSM